MTCTLKSGEIVGKVCGGKNSAKNTLALIIVYSMILACAIMVVGFYEWIKHRRLRLQDPLTCSLFKEKPERT